MRKKWTSQEDDALREILGVWRESSIDWKQVSERMLGKGFEKSARQTRERWVNQLDPRLERDSLNSEENERLLNLHSSCGNSWKKIAKSFPGRSDNGIKNQFFAMVRKSLRKARKAVRPASFFDSKEVESPGVAHVNEIKPKMLSKFLSLSVKLPQEKWRPSEFFHWSLENPVKISAFLQFFLLGRSANYEPHITPEVSDMIAYILDRLEEHNKEYVGTKNFRSNSSKKIAKKTRVPKRKPKNEASPPKQKPNSKSKPKLEPELPPPLPPQAPKANKVEEIAVSPKTVPKPRAFETPQPPTLNELPVIDEVSRDADFLMPSLFRRESIFPIGEDPLSARPTLERILSGRFADAYFGHELEPPRELSRRVSKAVVDEERPGSYQNFPRQLELRPKESVMSNLSSTFAGAKRI